VKFLTFRNLVPVTFAILISLLMSSCRTMNSNEMFRTDPDFAYSEFKPTEKEYKIQPFDKLEVRIYANDGFKLVDVSQITTQAQANIEYLVEYDGQVKLPTIGRVELSGKTLREAESFLENKYKEFFVDPFVVLRVTNKRIIVFSGGAANGKVIPLDNENYTLIEAIAESGGISDFSKSHKIKLLRGDLNSPQVFMFNIRDLKDMKTANFLLQANDIIYVEARPKYASRIIGELSPYLSLLTSALFVYGLFLK
jgi:polysaccharide export outer membrane protein